MAARFCGDRVAGTDYAAIVDHPQLVDVDVAKIYGLCPAGKRADDITNPGVTNGRGSWTKIVT